MISTVLPSGRLQNHPVWVGTDGERLVVNTETHEGIRKAGAPIKTPALHA